VDNLTPTSTATSTPMPTLTPTPYPGQLKLRTSESPGRWFTCPRVHDHSGQVTMNRGGGEVPAQVKSKL